MINKSVVVYWLEMWLSRSGIPVSNPDLVQNKHFFIEISREQVAPWSLTSRPGILGSSSPKTDVKVGLGNPDWSSWSRQVLFAPKYAS